MADNYRFDIEDIRDRLGDVYQVANELGDAHSRLSAIEERLSAIEAGQEKMVNAIIRVCDLSDKHADKINELVNALKRLFEPKQGPVRNRPTVAASQDA